METCVEKIRWVGAKAKELKCDAVIDGGDFFDIKSPHRNSHKLVQEAIKAHKDYPCPVYVCVGNHDCKYGDYAYLPEQPLGVLYESGVFQKLYDEHELRIGDVRVVGVPYHGTKYDHERFKIRKGEESHLVVVAHVLASQRGGSMFDAEEILSYDDFNKLCPDADAACFGHWHMDQGVVKSGNTHMVNTGSLTRGSLSQDNLERIPCVILLEFDNGKVRWERHNLPVKAASEVFDVDRKDQELLKVSAMETFVESISKTIRQEDRAGFREIIARTPNITDATRERAIHYLEQVGLK
jgi:DNA repair exonuclease SbcCD nuclease subunit